MVVRPAGPLGVPPGHPSRRNDPLYRIRNILCAGEDRLTERQRARLKDAFTARDEHLEVEVAWLCAQQVRSVYHQDTPAAGKARAEKVLESFTSFPTPVVASSQPSLLLLQCRALRFRSAWTRPACRGRVRR